MCEIIIFISENIDFANLVVTSLLTIVLICYTVRIGMQQNKLQADINNQQSQLQKTIAERETMINLYQYRMNCYVQVMDALDIIIYGKLEDYLGVFQKGGLEFIEKISTGRKMMLKAYIESEPIFNEQIVKFIGILYSKYDSLYTKSCDMLMVSDEELLKRQDLVIKKLNITTAESKENIVIKWSNFAKTEEGRNFIKEIIPEYEDCMAILKDLGEVFKSNNDLIKMMGEYINVKELNKI